MFLKIIFLKLTDKYIDNVIHSVKANKVTDTDIEFQFNIIIVGSSN